MIILPMSRFKEVTFYTLIISNMTNYDVDLELKEQQYSLYEDELDMFIDNYRTKKEFRENLKKEHDARITYEDYDECYWLYIWDDILNMDIHLDRLLEKLFNFIKRKEYANQLELNALPF